MALRWNNHDVIIEPIERFDAELRLPGSKSITNRYLACVALADGRSTLRHASPSDDAVRMLGGLGALGIDARFEHRRDTLTVEGAGGYPPAQEGFIDVEHAGTAMRFLTALAALAYGDFRLDGSARMRERPIGPLVEALRSLGARIEYHETDGCPPLTVHASGLRGGEVIFKQTPSSQFLSALLMVAPYAGGDVMIGVEGELPSRPYVDMTLAVMRTLRVEVVEHNERFIVAAPQRYAAGDYAIEPDASGATYFWAAAAATGGRARVHGLTRGSVQGDVKFVDVLEQMGCTVFDGPDYLEVRGPERGRLRAANVDLNAMPDTVQTLAVLALFADGRTEIRNVANLRVKETDRLGALTAELARLGARVDVHRDGLTIFPPEEFNAARIETYADHRMAMSFAVAGLMTPGITIADANCVSKSFPGFFDVLANAMKSGG